MRCVFSPGCILIEPITVEHGHLAVRPFWTSAKAAIPAGLNFGDCFAYALAKATGEALLYKGQDFSKTDLKAAA